MCSNLYDNQKSMIIAVINVIVIVIIFLIIMIGNCSEITLIHCKNFICREICFKVAWSFNIALRDFAEDQRK